MKTKVKSLLALILTLSVIMSFGIVSASAANTTSDYNKYNAPSSSDYVYWNGNKMVRASGTTDSEVMWCQASMNFLIDKGVINGRNLEKLVVEKSFGPKSSAMTKLFQKAVGLKQDGSFGKDTIAAMKTELKLLEEKAKPTRTTTTSTSTSKSNTNTTVKIVHPVTNGYCQGGRSGFLPYYRGLNKWAHVGVDYVTSSSDKNIKAFYSGTVTKVFWNGSAGNCIEIKHTYSGKTFYSYYFHLKSTSVKVNQTVSTGTKIGVMGNTGTDSTGVHLHFQISDKCCVNSNNSLKTPTDNASYKSMGQTAQFNLDKAKIASSGITFYNPEKVLSKGLSVIL